MTEPDESIDELDARLLRDARSWGGAPSAAARAELRARLAVLRRARRALPRRLVPLAAACALAATFLAWPRAREEAPPLPARNGSGRSSAQVLAAEATERALMPLRIELAGLTHDGEALARGIWAQVPAPLRRLVR
jgi:hypothetical protein